MKMHEDVWQPNLHQAVFRQLLDAYSRPGALHDLSPWINTLPALRVVLATLMDQETSLADPHGLIAATDWPLLQVRRDQAESANTVVADGHCAPDFEPALGSLDRPEFGASLLLLVDTLGSGPQSLRISGPGVDGERTLLLTGLHPDWLHRRESWVASFPLGVDLLLVDAHRIVALPRTSRVMNQTGGDLI